MNVKKRRVFDSMKVQLYRKKPVVIRALQFTGDNFEDILDFTRGIAYDSNGSTCMIPTLEGKHIATKGDYIIEGVHGEFYPCKPDIFHKTYEKEEKESNKK